MPWLSTIIAALPVLVMGLVALGPPSKRSAQGLMFALGCASAGSLLLAGQAPSLLGLLPCGQLPFSPPCQSMQVQASNGAYLALIGLLFWALAGVSLFGPQVSRNGRSLRQEN